MDAVIVLSLGLVGIFLALVVVVMDDGVASVPCWPDVMDTVVVFCLLGLVVIDDLALVVVVVDNGGAVVP